MRTLNFRDVRITNEEKLNKINFNKNDLPEGYYDCFLRANENCVNETGEGLSIVMASNHYWNTPNHFAFMLCIPFVVSGKLKYGTVPFIWYAPHSATYMTSYAVEFSDKDKALEYISQFENVHTGTKMGELVHKYQGKNK